MTLKIAKGLLLLAITSGAAQAAAQPFYPVIKGYGGIQSTEGAAERPDKRLRYQVVFEITKAAAEPGKVNPSLEKVARFLNLLGGDDVKPRAGDIVAIVHGPATPSILSDAAHRARLGLANPSTDLLKALRAAGVEVRVCSQALAGHKIERTSVSDLVQTDVSALTTIATLQLRGYALIKD